MLEILKNKILKNKKTILVIALFCFAFVLLFSVAGPAIAEPTTPTVGTPATEPETVSKKTQRIASDTGGSIASNAVGTAVAAILAYFAFLITTVIGLITTLLIKILVSTANFNNIIGVEAVRVGWMAVRDLCNMFFVLILLMIAFGTILKIESYNAKKLLPKLLIMAVLINFSKTIFGLIIDFSQVIMLTFTNAFASGHGWFTDMFRVDLWSKINTDDFKETPLIMWSVCIAVITGVFAAIITMIVIAVMLAVLVMRIVMLWIYTILSPLVFLGFAFDPIKKYTQQIWEDFIKNVIVGPILAFFIWLALTTARTSSTDLGEGIDIKKEMGTEICAGMGAFFCEDNFQKFIITIGLLVGGLMVAQQMGGAAGQIAGKGMGMIKGGVNFGKKFAWDTVKGTAKDTAKFGARNVLRAGGGLIESGFGLKKAKEGSTRSKIGSFMGQWGEDMQKTRGEEKTKKRLKTLESLGMRSDASGGQEKLQTLLEDEKVKKATNIAKGLGVAGFGALTMNPLLMVTGTGYGIGKMVTNKGKGPIADAMKYFGKGGDVRDAERKKKGAEESRDKVKTTKKTTEKARDEIKEKIVKDSEQEVKTLGDNKARDLNSVEQQKQRDLESLDLTRPNSNASDIEKKKYQDSKKEINKDAIKKAKEIEENFQYDKEAVYNKHPDKKNSESADLKVLLANDEVKLADDEVKLADDEVKTARDKRGATRKWMEGKSEEMEGPNHWTIEAAKKGTTENQVVKDLINALSSPGLDIGGFKNKFYSQGGPSSQHNKLFDYMSDPSSKVALNNMVRYLNEIRSSGKLNAMQTEVIIELKQGLASQEKGGKPVNQDLKDAVDKFNAPFQGKDSKTVDQCKDEVVRRT